MIRRSDSAKRETFSKAPTRVEAVMTRRVVTLSASNSCEEALAMMANHPFRHLLVVDADEQLCGVLSDRDLLRALIRTSDWSRTSVTELMTRDPVTVRLKTRLSAAVKRMLAHRVNCLPVTDGAGRVQGIMTSTDLLKAFLKLQRHIERSGEKHPNRKRKRRS